MAQLKRDVLSGKMSLALIERFGGNDEKHIPERMKGNRKVIGMNTVAIKLLNHDGKESELRLESASLTEYDGETLTIYNAGLREPTEQEKDTLNKANQIVKEYNEKYPFGNGGFWIKKEFFEKSDCPWMEGFKTIKGKRYEPCKDKVYDRKIKGDVILKYAVTMA